MPAHSGGVLERLPAFNAHWAGPCFNADMAQSNQAVRWSICPPRQILHAAAYERFIEFQFPWTGPEQSYLCDEGLLAKIRLMLQLTYWYAFCNVSRSMVV